MKHIRFLTILATALLGAQEFAAATTFTTLEGCTSSERIRENEWIYYGKNDRSASGVQVTISEGYENHSKDMVIAARAFYGAATDNKVTMTGGQVSDIYCGEAATTASGNTVIMTGGDVINYLYAGKSEDVASGNVAILVGHSGVGFLYGGSGPKATDNKIYLVGNGATATIADAQGNKATYTSSDTGGVINLYQIYGGVGTETSSGNSVDIYGTGTYASGSMTDIQILNFHIAEALAKAESPMFKMTSPSELDALNLTGVNLGFYCDDVQDWSVFDGKSITLVYAATQPITVEKGSLGNVEIKAEDGAVIATATLGLDRENKSLVLSDIKAAPPVPEPATDSLSLLALAGLAARRRRRK